MLRAVIFDLHGTLLDDELLRMNLLRELAADAGIELDPSFYASRLAGMDDRSGLQLLWAHAGKALPPDDLRRLLAEKTRRYAAAVEGGVPLFAGAQALVEEAARGYPVGVVAGSLRSDALAALKGAGLFRHLSALITADEVAMPSAQAWLRCLERMNEVLARYGRQAAAPRDVLVFEDTEVGIQAAQHARMKVAAVAHTRGLDRLEAAELRAPRIGDFDLAALEKELF